MNIVLANIYPFKPGELVGPHVSASELFLIVLRGHGRIDVQDGRWEPLSGDVLRLPWDCPRWYHAAEREPFTVIGVHRSAVTGPPPHRAVSMWPRTSVAARTGELHHDHEGHVRQVMERQVAWFAEPPSPARTAGLAAWSAALDVEWGRLADAPVADQRLGSVVSWMRLSLANSISREELADRAGMAESTFAAAFRDVYGKPPLQYLIALRIARAKELLLSSTASIPAVAAACGFSDPPHFARLFRCHTNETATAFRRSRRMM